MKQEFCGIVARLSPKMETKVIRLSGERAKVWKQILDDNQYIQRKAMENKMEDIKTERPDLHKRMMQGFEAMQKALKK